MSFYIKPNTIQNRYKSMKQEQEKINQDMDQQMMVSGARRALPAEHRGS